jgi:hypothetical protein
METTPFTPSKVICSAGINPWLGISCALDFGKKHYFRHGMNAPASPCGYRAGLVGAGKAIGDSVSCFRSAGDKGRAYAIAGP